MHQPLLASALWAPVPASPCPCPAPALLMNRQNTHTSTCRPGGSQNEQVFFCHAGERKRLFMKAVFVSSWWLLKHVGLVRAHCSDWEWLLFGVASVSPWFAVDVSPSRPLFLGPRPTAPKPQNHLLHAPGSGRRFANFGSLERLISSRGVLSACIFVGFLRSDKTPLLRGSAAK